MASGLNNDGSILFLSCDLQNSTQFKQKSDNEDWVATFLAFYTEFPAILSTLIATTCSGLQNRLLLWKAVGDELIFSIRLQSEEECSDAVDVWLSSMQEFEQAHLVEKTPMTLKGGAFLATVPTPDRRVAIPRTVGFADRSQLDAEAVNEQTLNAADDEGKFHAEYAMDFVGPSIDTGFRVLKYASRRYFVLTVEVAHILFKHYSFIERKDEAFLVGMHELKGVWGGKPYPVFAISRELASSVPAQLLAKAFGSTIGIADEHPRCRPPEVLEAIAEYRKDAEWRGAIKIPGASWGDFKHHSSANEARSRLDVLFDTSEEYVDTTQDAGEEESFADMPTQ